MIKCYSDWMGCCLDPINIYIKVQYYLGQCSCPTMFTLRKVGDGKYQIGDSKALIYMRVNIIISTQEYSIISSDIAQSRHGPRRWWMGYVGELLEQA